MIFKVLFNIILGFVISASGTYLGYISLVSLNANNLYLLLIPSMALLVIGGFVLIRASRESDLLIARNYHDDPQFNKLTSPSSTRSDVVLTKNNQIVNEWIKESDKKDKMKILEIAAAAEQQMKQDSKTPLE